MQTQYLSCVRHVMWRLSSTNIMTWGRTDGRWTSPQWLQVAQWWSKKGVCWCWWIYWRECGRWWSRQTPVAAVDHIFTSAVNHQSLTEHTKGFLAQQALSFQYPQSGKHNTSHSRLFSTLQLQQWLHLLITPPSGQEELCLLSCVMFRDIRALEAWSVWYQDHECGQNHDLDLMTLFSRHLTLREMKSFNCDFLHWRIFSWVDSIFILGWCNNQLVVF